MPLWVLGLVAFAVAVAITSPWWVPMIESITGREDDYESRIEKRED